MLRNNGKQLCAVVYWGVYAGIRRIPTSGFFGQHILTSVIINKQGTFRPFATPLCVYPPPFLAIHHWLCVSFNACQKLLNFSYTSRKVLATISCSLKGLKGSISFLAQRQPDLLILHIVLRGNAADVQNKASVLRRLSALAAERRAAERRLLQHGARSCPSISAARRCCGRSIGQPDTGTDGHSTVALRCDYCTGSVCVCIIRLTDCDSSPDGSRLSRHVTLTSPARQSASRYCSSGDVIVAALSWMLLMTSLMT